MSEAASVFAAGCIVVNTATPERRFLTIYDRHGAWSFPKGHCDPGETSQQTAIREVFEETGIQGELGPLVHSIVYPVLKKGVTRIKQVDYYLLYTSQTDVFLQQEEGITDYRWASAAEIMELLTHESVSLVFAQAQHLIDR